MLYLYDRYKRMTGPRRLSSPIQSTRHQSSKMHLPTLPVALLLASKAYATTLYLAGDSTCAIWPSTSVIQGWGFSFANYTSLTVSDQATAGRSARSYTREGRFDTIASNVTEGDYVVIEFGHNDGGSLTPTDNGRSECGDASGVCYSVYE